jgi:hypothetical protein
MLRIYHYLTCDFHYAVNVWWDIQPQKARVIRFNIESATNLLETFLSKQDNHIQFMRLQWLDYTCTLPARVLTQQHFRKLVDEGRYHEVGRGYLCLPNDSRPLYEDGPAVVVGKQPIIPDFESLSICP